MIVRPLPAIPGIRTMDFELARNVASMESDLSATQQDLERSGYKFGCTLNFPGYKDDNAGVLLAWLDEQTRADRRFYLSPPQAIARGNWAPVDLVSNGTFIGGATTGWTPTGATLSVNARRLKVKNTAAAIGVAQQVAIATEAGKPYALIADMRKGNVAAFRIRQLTSAGAAEFTLAEVVEGRGLLVCTPSGAESRIEVACNTAVAGDHVFFERISFARCLQVAGAAQTGNALNVDGGPATVNAALKAGEFVCVLAGTLFQLLRLTEDLDTDSGGAGVLRFEPALRAAPADDAAVIAVKPFSRMRLVDESGKHTVAPPVRIGLSVQAREDVTVS